jgi:hypothetical protein
VADNKMLRWLVYILYLYKIQYSVQK